MNKNETITITRETYNLIKRYVDVLNKISDAYILDDKKNTTVTAYVKLARWAVAYKIKSALDGDINSLVEALADETESLELIEDYGV